MSNFEKGDFLALKNLNDTFFGKRSVVIQVLKLNKKRVVYRIVGTGTVATINTINVENNFIKLPAIVQMILAKQN